MRWLLAAALLVPAAAGAYDANGVALGDSEAELTQRFPNAICKAMQWSSAAADRRCDDRALLGGVSGRITFYLKKDKVQAFDLRFDPSDASRLAAFLKKQYGAPAAETREPPEGRRGGELYKVRWQKGGERAVLTSQIDKRRAFFTVSRGDFEEEIYRVR